MDVGSCELKASDLQPSVNQYPELFIHNSNMSQLSPCQLLTNFQLTANQLSIRYQMSVNQVLIEYQDQVSAEQDVNGVSNKDLLRYQSRCWWKVFSAYDL